MRALIDLYGRSLRSLLVVFAAVLLAGPALAVTPKLAGGGDFSLYLKSDGTVLAWGDNYYGQLGNGSIDYSRSRPLPVPDLTGVLDIAAGWDHGLAVKRDGTVVAWGGDDYWYQLSLGNNPIRSGSAVVPGLAGIVAVTAGTRFSLALKSDGTVMAWGSNAYGQLGDGSTTDRSSPAAVPGLSGVIAIASHLDYSLAVKVDGTVVAWGRNDYGQLGDGTITDRSSPVVVPGLSGVVVVAAGGAHSLALKGDGTVMAWGSNTYGQLGDGSTTDRYSPVAVPGLSGVVAIAAAGEHSLAVKSDGAAVAWGYNYYGQLGDGSTVARSGPVDVTGLNGAMSVAAGRNYSLALKRDGTVMGWGYPASGVLGENAWLGGYGLHYGHPSPRVVLPQNGVTAIAAGDAHSLAARSGGSVLAWGRNTHGQLGDGTTTDRYSPVIVQGLIGVQAVAAGNSHSLVAKNDGAVATWGNNTHGQLGDGTTMDRHSPVVLQGLSTPTGGVAAGAYHSVAWSSRPYYGWVNAWGSNGSGQVGDGTTTDRTTPTYVTSPDVILAVAAGGDHNLYSFESMLGPVVSLGVVAWGQNDYGQLGDGTTTNRLSIVMVPGLNVGRTYGLAAGNGHSLADRGGTVVAWGRNNRGQLGDGTTTDRLTPVEIPGLGAMALAAGNDHSLALISDGTVKAWGGNDHGQLGDGTTTDRSSPVAVPGLNGVVRIAAGNGYSLALKIDGTVVAWGRNDTGQLGNGSNTDSLTPTRIDDRFPANGAMPARWVATSGSANGWTVASHEGFGPDSLKSGSLGDGAFSGIQFTGNFRDGFVTFQRKISSEADGDYLRFYVDGILKGEWSGEQDWARAGAFVSAGTHTLAWQYEKNGSASAGADAAWIDSVEQPAVFSDVSAAHWASAYIDALYAHGITTGCDGVNYCPTQTVTRAQMAALIIRAVEGEPAACATPPFSDVPTTNGFCKYIARMKDLAFTTGCGNGNYCPSQTVDRQQMAAFIIRAVEGEPAACTSHPFNDVPVGHSFCKYVQRMKDLAITTGCGNSNYCPTQVVTRDQMAAFLSRAFLGM